MEDVDVRNLYIHDTAGRLSHQIASDWCLMEPPEWAMRLSKARKCMKMPISSRSEMVMLPAGLEAEQSSFRMSSGHGMYHTNGSSGLVPPNQTPPTPHLDASTRPW